MRSLYYGLCLTATVAVLGGCADPTSGPSAIGNEAGGGGVTNVSNQAPVTSAEKGVLVDGGTKAYTGYNATATDALPATPPQSTDATADKAPPDVAGSHAIAYAGNGLTQQIFAYSGTVPSLTLPVSTPGDILALNYAAIVFSATPPASAASLSIELTGGTGATAYDVRIACTSKAVATGTSTLADRYTCPLPAYGSATSNGLVNPVTSNSLTGTFTPTAPKLYLVVNEAAPLAATATATLLVDYLFAEDAAT